MLVVAGLILGQVKILQVKFFSWSGWKLFSTFKTVRARSAQVL